MLTTTQEPLLPIEEAALRNLNFLRREMQPAFEKALRENTLFFKLQDPLCATIQIRINSSCIILELAAQSGALAEQEGSLVLELRVQSSKDFDTSKFNFFAEGTKLSFSSSGTKLSVGRRMAAVCEKMTAIENVT